MRYRLRTLLMVITVGCLLLALFVRLRAAVSARYVLILPLVVAVAHGNDLSDAYTALDGSLRNHSPRYRAMADEVRKRQPYRIESRNNFPLGNVRDDDGGLVIELNSDLPKERRATILIWEMSNAYQRDICADIARRAKAGEIASPR
jgi:hypothetical protein